MTLSGTPTRRPTAAGAPAAGFALAPPAHTRARYSATPGLVRPARSRSLMAAATAAGPRTLFAAASLTRGGPAKPPAEGSLAAGCTAVRTSAIARPALHVPRPSSASATAAGPTRSWRVAQERRSRPATGPGSTAARRSVAAPSPAATTTAPNPAMPVTVRPAIACPSLSGLAPAAPSR